MNQEVRRSVLIVVAILAIVIIGLLIYFSSKVPSTDIYASHCKIKSDFANIKLSLGVSSSLSLSGYQGTLNQVSWTSENPDVAVVNPVSGPDAFVQAKSSGTTTIVATDNAVGPKCTVSIPVSVN